MDAELAMKTARASVAQIKSIASRNDTSVTRYTAAYIYDFMEFAAGRFESEGEYFLHEAKKMKGMRFDFNEAEIPAHLLSEMPLGSRQSHL